MIKKIEELLVQIESFRPEKLAEIEEFRIRMMGKKGEITTLFEEFKQVSAEQKRELGQKINVLKNKAIDKINALKEQAEAMASMNPEQLMDMDLSRDRKSVV